MKELIIDILTDVFKDTLKLVPFLFLTYLLMEYVEHKAGERSKERIAKAGNFGPAVGALLGAVPQCGFSAAASNLYAGRVITVGTLIAVYLSTSDEMLPIFISEQVPAIDILKIIAIKVIIGLVAGFMLDFAVRHFKNSKSDNIDIHRICEHDHCNCEEEGILKSAINHTFQITGFIFLVSLVLGFVIEFVGVEALGNFITNKPVIGELIAGLIGLIPNCAASVVITQLYLEGALSFGAMMSGLLVGAGIGIAILIRMNEDKKKSAQIIAILYGIGVVFGILIEVLGINI